MKIRKGDKVQIMSGKDSGKQGKVLKVDPKKGKVLVEGLNVFKKHKRASKQGGKGEIVEVSRPLNASNVLPVCASCNLPTRVGYKTENGNKSRYCKKCKAAF